VKEDDMPDALADFVRASYTSLLRHAVLLVGDRGEAEDLVQEALSRLWSASRRRPVNNPYAYTRTVLVRLAIKRGRARRLRHVLMQTPPDNASADKSSNFEDHDQMWQAICRLPPRQRAVLILRYYEDLPEPEICDVLGVTAGTVRSQSAKARANLRLLLHSSEGVVT
jgi:RNA polymerase sigma-70 factor (sigma-E family)